MTELTEIKDTKIPTLTDSATVPLEWHLYYEGFTLPKEKETGLAECQKQRFNISRIYC